MKIELDKQLCEHYPTLYADRNADMRATCMCWGFECDDGWFALLDDLSRKLSELPQIPRAVQVKEKYGTLRFYIAGGSDEAYNLIDTAENISANTCEVCGEVAQLCTTGGPYGWLKTLCDPCATKLHYLPYPKDDNEDDV